ncbi:MAG: hypothetical protein V1822_00025 [Candidatus Micrarchaeota archaeon]
MAKIEGKFQSAKAALCAKSVLEKSLSAVGSSKIEVEAEGQNLKISIRDSSPSSLKAAEYSAKRLMNMLIQMDKSIKQV